MEFRMQFAIAAIVACVIAIPITIAQYKEFQAEGKSINYLSLKMFIAIIFPVMSIPVLLSKELSIGYKLLMISSMVAAGSAYICSVTSARKAFRKILGLPPEDDVTGEVIKEDKKIK
jgi:hypothetical protein